MATSPKLARDSAGLIGGTLLNGGFAYVFFALVTRGLGAEEAAPITVLWTYWGLSMAAIAFPTQHWIIRTLWADGEHAVRSSLPGMLAAVAVVAAAATAVGSAGRERLFLDDGFVFPALVGFITIGSFFSGLVRGGLAGHERFLAASVSLAADNILRVVLAVLVLQTGGGALGIGIALTTGAVVGLAWPSGYRFRREEDGKEASSGLSLLGMTAVGQLLGQSVLISAPALLALLGGAPTDVTMLFVTLALFRVPYLLTIGLSNKITGALTAWVSEDTMRAVSGFKVAVTAFTGASCILGGLAGYAAGPALVSLVFGGEIVPPRWVAAIVASGSIIAVGNLLFSLFAIAQGRGGRLARAWLLGACVGGTMALSLPVPALEAVTWGFLCGELTAFAALLFWGISSTYARWVA